MLFVRLDQLSAVAPFVDGSFNGPSFTADFTLEHFEREYAAVHEQVFDCLQRAEAGMDGLAEEAFSMGPQFSRDRLIILAITYVTLLTVELLRELQQIVAEEPEDYRVVLDGSDTHGEQFYVVITKGKTIGYSQNPKALVSLGFDSTGA
jgi:hypothetical protein